MNTTQNITTQELTTVTLDSLNTNLTFDELKKFRIALNKLIQSHDEYEKPEKKAHIEYKNNAITKAMLKLYGLNGAFNTLKEMIAKKTIILSKCSTLKIDKNQYAFVSKNLKQCKHFMPKDMKTQKQFTPQDILNTFIKASTMLQTNYAKHVKTF